MTYGFSLLLDKDVKGVSRNSDGEIRYVGTIDQEKVELVMRLYQPGDRLLITSSGGDLFAGMMLGDFINSRKMSIEVVGFCISSCANYVFLSGAQKILNPSALVIFHGGPKQENFRELMRQAYSEQAKPGSVFGREGFEAVISTTQFRRSVNLQSATRGNACGLNEVMNTYGECEEFGAEERLQYIIYLENELYSGVNPDMDKNIPYYGQRGEYEALYKTYKYFGFYYDLESLARLNVSNVSVKTGQWRPQSNPLFAQVYEVKID